MIECRLAEDHDRDRWNEFVYALARKGIYNTLFDWKEIIEHNLGERGLFAIAERSGQLVGIYPGFITSRFVGDFPLVRRIFRRLVSYEGLAWDYNGPCAKENDAEVVKALVSYMDFEAKNLGATDAVIRPYLGDLNAEQVAGESLLCHGYKEDGDLPFLSQTIDLTKDEKELWNEISKDHRESAVKLRRMGFEIVEDSSEESIAILHDCLRKIQERVRLRKGGRMVVPSINFFKAMLAPHHPPIARLFSVRREGITYEVNLETYLHDLICDRWGGAPEFVRGLSVDAGFCCHNILTHKQKGFRVFDNCWLPRHRTGPLYFFKSRFGGSIREITCYSKTFSQPRSLILRGAKLAHSAFQAANSAT